MDERFVHKGHRFDVLTKQQAALNIGYRRHLVQDDGRFAEDSDDGSDGEEDQNPFVELRGRRERPVVQNNTSKWEFGFKLDILEFHGCLQPEEFLDWVTAVEEILEFKEVLDDRRASLVGTKFRGRAAAWW